MTDLLGYPYNGKYPPKGDKHGLYHGYSSDAEETLFYDFAVQGYDLTFVYKGQRQIPGDTKFFEVFLSPDGQTEALFAINGELEWEITYKPAD